MNVESLSAINGMRSGAIQIWAKEWGIRFEYIQPGKPQQNAYVERFNRTVRYEWLSQYYWSSIEEVQDYATQWMWSYNHAGWQTGLVLKWLALTCVRLRTMRAGKLKWAAAAVNSKTLTVRTRCQLTRTRIRRVFGTGMNGPWGTVVRRTES